MEDYFDLKLYIVGLRDPYTYVEGSSKIEVVDKWEEYSFLCANLDTVGFVEISDIHEKVKDHDGIAITSMSGDKHTFRIYSLDDSVDCGQISLTYGGAGDKNIGLFVLDEEMFSKVISR